MERGKTSPLPLSPLSWYNEGYEFRNHSQAFSLAQFLSCRGNRNESTTSGWQGYFGKLHELLSTLFLLKRGLLDAQYNLLISLPATLNQPLLLRSCASENSFANCKLTQKQVDLIFGVNYTAV
jgi:hypothetical protein